MRPTDPLNGLQLKTLRWIADGCKPGDEPGPGYKRTAGALQDRKLVKVDKRGGTWSATLTDDGLYCLDHGGPRSQKGRTTTTPARPATSRSEGTASVTVGGAEPSRDSAAVRPLPPTEQLVADVVAAGGRLVVQADQGHMLEERTKELVRNANRYGKTPPGKRMRLDLIREPGDKWWTLPRRFAVVLEDGPAGTDAELEPVPVPDEVRRYHPAITALRKGTPKSLLAVDGRRWRILHGLAIEAERRGYTVTNHVPRPPRDARSRPERWDLLLSQHGETVPLLLSHESERVEHVPTARELAEQKRNSWFRMPTHDTVSTARLRIEIAKDYDSERRSSWADRSRWTLEDKLPEVMREIAVRIDELRMKREAKVRAEAAYAEAVEQENVRARERAGESHRQEVLDKQLQRWREAAELRGFAADVAKRVQVAEDAGEVDDIAATRRWLAWIESRAASLDPLTTLPTWPAAPDLPSWELEKFMRHVDEPMEMRYRPSEY